MIEEMLVAYVKTQTGLTSIIGTGTNTRFFPSSTASNPLLPAIVYRRVSSVREHDFAGARGSSKSRFQMDVLGSSYTEVKNLAAALRAALDGYTTQEILSSKLENEFDSYEGSADVHRVVMDFIIYHTE